MKIQAFAAKAVNLTNNAKESIQNTPSRLDQSFQKMSSRLEKADERRQKLEDQLKNRVETIYTSDRKLVSVGLTALAGGRTLLKVTGREVAVAGKTVYDIGDAMQRNGLAFRLGKVAGVPIKLAGNVTQNIGLYASRVSEFNHLRHSTPAPLQFTEEHNTTRGISDALRP